MRIAIVGAGAIGGGYGVRLYRAGEDVTFLARGASLDVLRSTGLTFHTPEGTTVTQVPTVASFDEIDHADQLDLIIVATKALRAGDWEEAFTGLPAGVPVLTTHNSVEAPYRAAEIIGAERIIPAVVRTFIHYEAPGEITQHPGTLSLTFGAWEGGGAAGPHAHTIRQLEQALQRAGITAIVHSDIWVDIWEKSMFVASCGVLGAIFNAPIGELRSTYRRDLQAVVEDFARVGRAHGVHLGEDVVERTMSFVDASPAAATTSMQRDYAAGKANELDAQIGAVVRLAAETKVPAPAATFAYDVARHLHRAR
ncbi:2-dehydropantoate 2-reductase [Corynebacterium ciconiae]|uniref:2-dehydropantoate 2-reductase n=1 Tax=Corynebacterium ciconiae TaxID=227319 RepID=UPI0003693B5E|nr:2-dehydropantoate 2-reductase [Corynebacterium ciconiae]